MKLSDLTIDNITDFIQGNTRWLWDGWDLLPRHQKEQVLYRASKCDPRCAKEGKCVGCGCDYPQKLYVNKSCNPNVSLPDLMSEQDWENYKLKLKEKQKTNNGI